MLSGMKQRVKWKYQELIVILVKHFRFVCGKLNLLFSTVPLGHIRHSDLYFFNSNFYDFYLMTF